jgi:hypothetical protein
MLDKIVIVNKNQAYMIFVGRNPVSITSDEDVRVLVLWLLGDPRAHIQTNEQEQFNGVIELRRDTSYL